MYFISQLGYKREIPHNKRRYQQQFFLPLAIQLCELSFDKKVSDVCLDCSLVVNMVTQSSLGLASLLAFPQRFEDCAAIACHPFSE